MNRLRSLLHNTDRRKMLVPFFTAGYPSKKGTVDLVKSAVDAGADMVEIGMPFSDPLADGPAIQHSSFESLKRGTTLKEILGSVETLRESIDVPLVLMGYYNPLLVYGQDRFLRDAASAGVDGLIIPDLPVEEGTEYTRLIRKHDLSAVFLVSPTSTEQRAKLIDKTSTDLVYAVTVTGVTGTGKVFGSKTDTYLKWLKSVLKKPFVAGFGVSSPESARRMARYSDGVVIGSALVEIIRKSGSNEQARKRTHRFLKDIRKALV